MESLENVVPATGVRDHVWKIERTDCRRLAQD
jgi:hypothetical protein